MMNAIANQQVFRHGDRSPTHTFPTDVNNGYWTDGLGQLTNIGKQQQFALGQFIRQRYNGYLNETYNFEEIFINSTDVDRTIMSVYCNLAGLYPPFGAEVWNDDLAWQPIPVHIMPVEIDYVIDCVAYCPKYDQIFDTVKVSPEVQLINVQYADLYAFVQNNSGYNVYDLFSLSNVYDALFCDKCHNLTIPDWALSVWDSMEYLKNVQMYYEWGTPQIARLTGGPLIGYMADNMNLKIDGKINRIKAMLYSSHDSKLTAVLSALGVWNGILPPYASAVFVELHQLDNGDHGVQVLYYNDTSLPPLELTIPGCTSPCPIGQFANLTSAMVPADIIKECTLIPSIFDRFWNWITNLYNGFA